MTTKYVRIIDGVTYDFNDFDVTWQFINDNLPRFVQNLIDEFVQSRKRLREGKETFESYLRRIETDPKQQTQAVTKRLQYDINDALDDLLEFYGLQDIIGPAGGSGKDYIHLPTGIPVEVKSSGAKDGTVACVGNINSSVKVDDTIAIRYTLTGNKITHWQMIRIMNSNRKWKEYNPIQYKKNKKTKEFILDENGNKIIQDSSYSGLKCKPIDEKDIVKYSGTYKVNSDWIKFIKEEINA